MPDPANNRFVVSVLVGDRAGILRDIATAISDMGAEIDGVSQTVVEGYFTVILTVSTTAGHVPDEIKAAIEERFGTDEAAIAVRPYGPGSPSRYTTEGDRYIVTLTGSRHLELFRSLTAFLASKDINIEDWYMARAGESVTHIGEVSVPHLLDIKQLHDELSDLAGEMDAKVHIQHENIFRATNDIGPIKSLLRTKPC